jgi:hypothetical protein
VLGNPNTPRNFSLVAERISFGRTPLRMQHRCEIHAEDAVQTSELAPTISDLADWAADDYAAVSF